MKQTDNPPATSGSPTSRRWRRAAREHAAMLLIWIGLVVLFSALSDRFLSAATFSTLAGQIPALTVVAAGMTLVIITAGIDLSVGSVLGAAGAVFGIAVVSWQWPLPAAALLAIAAGAAAGWANGWICVRLRVPSFIVTLGMLEIARGCSYLLTGSQTMYLAGALGSLSRPLPVIELPPAFLVAIAVVILLQLVLTRTVYGRHLIAVGTNEEAVRLTGIRPAGLRISVFVITGALVGLGALFYTARLGSADPNAGVGLELSAIAAVVIGGTSLMGGRGSVISTFFGVLIIATLDAGLAQVGASEPVKRVITGGVIVAAAVIDGWRTGGGTGVRTLFRRLWSRPISAT
jgi:ribose transport system permease protein